MSQRRVVIDVKPPGLLGWLLVALIALPLLVLSFFFLTIAAVVVGAIVVLAAVRILWLRYRLRRRGPNASWDRSGSRPGEVIDVEPVDVTHASDAGNAAPFDTLPPRLP